MKKARKRPGQRRRFRVEASRSESVSNSLDISGGRGLMNCRMLRPAVLLFRQGASPVASLALERELYGDQLLTSPFVKAGSAVCICTSIAALLAVGIDLAIVFAQSDKASIRIPRFSGRRPGERNVKICPATLHGQTLGNGSRLLV